MMAPLLFVYGLTLGSVPLPGTSSVSVPLSPPSACGRCHGAFDLAGSAFDTWAGSAMGHAARDPLFLAAMVEAERDSPGVGDFCMRCHAPEAWLQGRCFPTDGSALEASDSGITCSLCHRMDANPWLRNGQYNVGDDSDLRGPYGDSAAPHHKQASTWLSSAALCGTCHDLFSPSVRRRNLDGSETAFPFPEQTTYSEWLASAYAREDKDCVDCHMPELAGPIADGFPSRPDRSSHALVGGNAFLLDAIAFLNPSLGLSDQLARGRNRVVAMLQTAAEIELTVPQEVRRGEVFQIQIKVTNLSGHKLPTGYPEGRRVFVSLNSSELEMNRGEYDESTGEPLHAVQVYRVEQGQHGQGPGAHLALNDTVFFDNRIPPRGFVSTTTIAPVASNYPVNGAGEMAHYDVQIITASVACDAAWATTEISAGLWYQSTTKKHLARLITGAGNTSHADRLRLVKDSISFAPIAMAAKTQLIRLDQNSACEKPDAGFPGDAPSLDAGPRIAIDAGSNSRPADVGVGHQEVTHCSCVSTHGQPSYGDFWAFVVLFCLCRIRFRLGRQRTN